MSIKELVIISGKGGTGKTSLTAALAKLSGHCVLADCDVDAADLHLVTSPQREKEEPFMAGWEAVIDSKKCVGCGICQNLCRYGAVLNSPGGEAESTHPFVIEKAFCEGCGVCVWGCPAVAIELKSKQSGQWFQSRTPYGPMIHARLGIASENSGKLVSQVRFLAKEIAQSEQYDLIITDGPPGIGCPVIASITGASHLLVVTEPTLSGAHDLERVLKLAAHFQLSVSVCINKWDLNPEQTGLIENQALNHKAKLAGRIPYDPVFSKAQVKGISVREMDSIPVKEAVDHIWNHLKSYL